jgi:hypothetical protein
MLTSRHGPAQEVKSVYPTCCSASVACFPESYGSLCDRVIDVWDFVSLPNVLHNPYTSKSGELGIQAVCPPRLHLSLNVRPDEIAGSHGGGCEAGCLIRCCALLSGRSY